MMSSWGIMLLSENFPALWSITILKSVECGFGMMKTGMQYMPGKSSSPKDSEKCPLKILWWCWSHKNWASFGSASSGRERLSVSGYSPKWVSAQGQGPSQRPQHTDSTKGWLRWDSSNLWKWSTKIGVTMSKRWGFSLIVFVVTGLASSDDGIGGSGKAVSVQSAEDGENWFASSQILFLRYLGHNSCARSFFDIATFFSMAQVLATFAGMSETTVIAWVSAPTDQIETVAYFWLGRFSSRPLCIRSDVVRLNSVRHDDGGVKSCESMCVSEQHILSTTDFVPDSNVIEDNFSVGGLNLSGEMALNVLPIFP